MNAHVYMTIYLNRDLYLHIKHIKIYNYPALKDNLKVFIKSHMELDNTISSEVEKFIKYYRKTTIFKIFQR